MTYENIVYEKRDNVGYITLNRPQVLNARDAKMRQELRSVVEEIKGDPEVRAVVITGAGDKAFSVGRDLREVSQPTSLVESRRLRPLENDVEALASLDRPVIAAINGYALGGGCELALACDIRIAADHARLGLPEVTRGMIPGSGGTQRLPRIVGKAKALELILTGAQMDAQEAYRIGLVNMVVPKEELIATAERIARKIAEQAPVAVRYAKEAVNKGLDLPLEQGLRLEGDLSWLLTTTEDLLEGARAFSEKRPPQFKGR